MQECLEVVMQIRETGGYSVVVNDVVIVSSPSPSLIVESLKFRLKSFGTNKSSILWSEGRPQSKSILNGLLKPFEG